MIGVEQLDIFAISLGAAIVVIATLLRRWAGEKVAVRNAEILVALVPVALFLLFSGPWKTVGGETLPVVKQQGFVAVVNIVGWYPASSSKSLTSWNDCECSLSNPTAEPQTGPWPAASVSNCL